MTRYFYDCEFLEDGRTIELISIGIVADDGREFYAVAEEIETDAALYQRIRNHQWLMANVVPQLPLKPGFKVAQPGCGQASSFILDDTSNAIMPRRMLRNAVRDFLLDAEGGVELWADHGAYDHVVLAQLFGPMSRLPKGIPMFTHEFAQAWAAADRPALPEQAFGGHNALWDARHLKACFDALPKLHVTDHF